MNRSENKMNSLKPIDISQIQSTDREGNEFDINLLGSPISSKLSSRKSEKIEEEVMCWFNKQGIEFGDPTEIKDCFSIEQRKQLSESTLSL